MTTTKLHCKFCHQSCLRPLPAETPQAMRNAFEHHQVECVECRPVQQYGIMIATCAEGQTSDRFHVGYAWREIAAALTILKLRQAVQQYKDKHPRGCICSDCAFAENALWLADEKECAHAATSPV